MTPIDLHEMATREREEQGRYRCRLLCCSSTACLSSGAVAARRILEQEVRDHGLEREVQVAAVGCMGLCSRGPLMKIRPRGEATALYQRVTRDAAATLFEEHVLHGTRVASHLLDQDLPFFGRQRRIVLANVGEIDPERLEDYVSRGGYAALEKVLAAMTPAEVIAEVRASGLRGRGGAGYPTGKKWTMLHQAVAERKYLIANGDEGDPGAYMDRTVMEDDPHRVLEGMIIAGYAVGADKGFLYVRAEYPLAVERLERAIHLARRHGLLGEGILGHDFDFDVEIRVGAGAFVCGEETALMASIEGRRGNPVLRPPYPTQRGLWGFPTMINNVETLANVPAILAKGATWFAGTGTTTSKGTKVFALAGHVLNSGLIEVPMGTTLREIVFDIGGGIPEGREFKAAQTGGPSGGCIPAAYLDTPVDYENLQALGSIMGSGGLIVMDERVRMPDIAKFFMEFCMDESCGKCVPCRAGTVQMYQLLSRIGDGLATRAELERLEELCDMVKHASLCGLGQAAPNPVISTLRYFRNEYEKLLTDDIKVPV